MFEHVFLHIFYMFENILLSPQLNKILPWNDIYKFWCDRSEVYKRVSCDCNVTKIHESAFTIAGLYFAMSNKKRSKQFEKTEYVTDF